MNDFTLPPTALIEVVVKKQMTFSKYLELREQFLKKGYSCQAYQIGFYEHGGKEVDNGA